MLTKSKEFLLVLYPFLRGLVAQVERGGVPVHSDVGIAHTSPVLCALNLAATAESESKGWMWSVKRPITSTLIQFCSLFCIICTLPAPGLAFSVRHIFIQQCSGLFAFLLQNFNRVRIGSSWVSSTIYLHMVQWKVVLPMEGGWNGMSFKVPSIPL